MAGKGLGRGLGSLLGILDDEKEVTPVVNEERVEVAQVVVPEGEVVEEIAIGLIDNNPNQPRKNFDPTALSELAQSIKMYGVIQPILVTKKNDRYMIVAGERRFRATKLAEKKTIPAIIGPKPAKAKPLCKNPFKYLFILNTNPFLYHF